MSTEEPAAAIPGTGPEDQRVLRTGWTTGACAAAGAKAALIGLCTSEFPDPVTITLPKGQQPAFALAQHRLGADEATVSIIKDAGDDPDVTHGAVISTTIRRGPAGSGVTFHAGEGVGTVTKPGLPLAVGEPAINPGPRAMILTALQEAAMETGTTTDVAVTISIRGGHALALKTLNPRLGILGGLSVLGTTGIVVPYSCSAWIHSIHRGIDVARASGLDHIAGATGATSEGAIAARHGLEDAALIDMGDFAGGMLKYLRTHPVRRVTVAGGFAKMTKLGAGFLDLHSRSGAVDFDWIAERVLQAGGHPALAERTRQANSALEVLQMTQAAGLDLGTQIAEAAWATAAKTLRGAPILLDVAVLDREGRILAETEPRAV